MELVTGATGYVGSRLLRRLAADGRAVRALARPPERVERAARRGGRARRPAERREGLAEALAGCDTAYYLVHSMEAGAAAGQRLRRARPARGHGVRRGGRGRRRGADRLPGRHRAGGRRPPRTSRSRLEVEEILLAAVPGSTALRASIVIGAGSSSFRVLVRLVERLRLLPLPRWRSNRTQPIDERDVIEYLARTPTVPEAAGRSLDICGPDVLTFAALVEGIADALGVGRMPVGLPASLTPPASAVVAAVTGQPIELVRPLMESLESDVLPRDPARGGAALRHPPARLRARARPRARRVGVARAAGGAVKVERTVRLTAPPQERLRRGDGLRRGSRTG